MEMCLKNNEFRDKNKNLAENFNSLSEIGRKTLGKQKFSFKAVSINCVMLKFNLKTKWFNNSDQQEIGSKFRESVQFHFYFLLDVVYKKFATFKK